MVDTDKEFDPGIPLGDLNHLLRYMGGPMQAQELLARELTIAAKRLDAPPAYWCNNRMRGDANLSKPVYWKGRQWAVTAYGVECREHYYPIAKERYDEEEYGWVRHMAEKVWVDIADFAEALRIGRRIRDGIR